jgi:hypothetical protein
MLVMEAGRLVAVATGAAATSPDEGKVVFRPKSFMSRLYPNSSRRGKPAMPTYIRRVAIPWRRPAVVAALLAVVLSAGALGVRWTVRASRTRWAERVAVPEISRLMSESHPLAARRLIVVLAQVGPSADHLPNRFGAFAWRRKPGGTLCSIRMPMKPAEYAARLYSVLHRLDAEGWNWIAVELPPSKPEWAAIHDRLRRAAGR